MRSIALALLFGLGLAFTTGCTSESSPTKPSTSDKPDMTKPDMTKPDMTKPDMTKPDMTKPDMPANADDVKKEAAGMDKSGLQKAIDNTKSMIEAKEKQANDLLAKIKEFSPADALTDKVKTVMAEKDRLLEEVNKLRANLEVYMSELTKRG